MEDRLSAYINVGKREIISQPPQKLFELGYLAPRGQMRRPDSSRHMATGLRVGFPFSGRLFGNIAFWKGMDIGRK